MTLVILGLCPCWSLAQEPGSTLRSEVTEIRIPFARFDQQGRFVGCPLKQDLALFVDGQERTIESVNPTTDEPLTVAFVLQFETFSHAPQMTLGWQMVKRLRSGDRCVAINSLHSRENTRIRMRPVPKVNRESTSETKESCREFFERLINDNYNGVPSWQRGTFGSLPEGLVRATARLEKIRPIRPAIVAFSTYSSLGREFEKKVLPALARGDVTMYGMYPPWRGPSPLIEERLQEPGAMFDLFPMYERETNWLRSWSHATGGDAFAEESTTADQAFDVIEKDLRRQCQLTFKPTPSEQLGTTHQIHLELRGGEGHLRYQESFNLQ